MKYPAKAPAAAGPKVVAARVVTAAGRRANAVKVVSTAKEVVAKGAKAALTAKKAVPVQPVAASVIFQANARKIVRKDAEDSSFEQHP